MSEKDAFILTWRNGKPIVMTPKEWAKKQKGKKGRRITEEELKPFMFHGGDPNLSQNIDEILYGSGWA